MKFASSEDVSSFLLNNAVKIGYCKWQLFDKKVIDKGDMVKILYSCQKRYCDA